MLVFHGFPVLYCKLLCPVRLQKIVFCSFHGAPTGYILEIWYVTTHFRWKKYSIKVKILSYSTFSAYSTDLTVQNHYFPESCPVSSDHVHWRSSWWNLSYITWREVYRGTGNGHTKSQLRRYRPESSPAGHPWFLEMSWISVMLQMMCTVRWGVQIAFKLPWNEIFLHAVFTRV